MHRREQDWARAMKAARRGDATAYENLLADIARSLRPALRAKLRRRSLGDAEAEDVVQEVLMAIHAKRGTWEEDRPFLPWLNAIARHKLVDAMRRLSREARRHQHFEGADWDDLFEATIPDPDRNIVDLQRHIDEMPARQRDVVGALVLEGKSVRDVADRLGTSEGVVRMVFHRALAGLRKALHPAASSDNVTPVDANVYVEKRI